MLTLLLFTCAALSMGLLIIYNGGILPGVSANGIDVGGMSQAEAAAALAGTWDTLTLRDEGRSWSISAAELGLTLDAAATAERAHAQGRGQGSLLTAIFGSVEVAPVIRVDDVVLAEALEARAAEFELAPRNAGIAFVDGAAQPTPPQAGRILDTPATVASVANGTNSLLDGAIDLVMIAVPPQITDAAPLVAAAQQRLAQPLTLRLFDPVTGEISTVTPPTATWAGWLVAQADPTQPGGLALSADPAQVRAYLEAQSAALPAPRYLDIDAAVERIQAAIATGEDAPVIRVYHGDSVHTVQSGESLTSIAWDYGVPYPWIQQANPGLGDVIAIGQQITIPSPDNFFDFAPVVGKRIIVSMSQQRTRVYENGTLIWDWPASTGIADSPTWPGVYQIISHEPNAYAARWNLNMPYFMGVYRPIPGQDFTNGFHGFPTRGSSQLLWTNSLGTRVTYGCILLSDTNARLLYDWAEEGVVVEILP